jgi:hypothetical protein
MKRAFLQLSCATALGLLAVGAQAQYGTPASPAAGSPSAGSPAVASTTSKSPTQVDADYAANVARCNQLAGLARSDCMQDARAAYDRSVNQMPSGTGAAGGAGTPSTGVPVKRN